MERTEYASGTVQLRGSGTVYRILNFFGEHLLGGTPAKVAWWDDSDLEEAPENWPAARAPEQTELWSSVVAETSVRSRRQKGEAARSSSPEFRAHVEQKRNALSLQDRARLLNISTALYDGRAEVRRLDLPQGRLNFLRSQLNTGEALWVDSRPAKRPSTTATVDRTQGLTRVLG